MLRRHFAGHRAGEGLPSSRRHLLSVPSPIPRGVLRGCTPGSSPLPWPSPRFPGLGSPSLSPESETLNEAAGFASRYGPLSRSPFQGFRRWTSTPGVSPRPRQPATGPPGSYPNRTLTGRRRRAVDFRSAQGLTSISLGARMIGVKDLTTSILNTNRKVWKVSFPP